MSAYEAIFVLVKLRVRYNKPPVIQSRRAICEVEEIVPEGGIMNETSNARVEGSTILTRMSHRGDKRYRAVAEKRRGL